MMRQSLARWDKLSDEEKSLSSESNIRQQHRWEDSYPKDGLILNMITRDLPDSCDPNDPCEAKWNQDFAWFSREEARQWLPIEIRKGATHTLPEQLTSRLARTNLVDTVKGQTIPFESNEVIGSKIQTEVTNVRGDQVEIKITGQTKSHSSKTNRRQSARGVQTQLLGNATFDLSQTKFTKFEFVALGKREGYTRFNFRNRDGMSNMLGFVFRLAPENSPKVAPAFIYDYGARWVKYPNFR